MPTVKEGFPSVHFCPSKWYRRMAAEHLSCLARCSEWPRLTLFLLQRRISCQPRFIFLDRKDSRAFGNRHYLSLQAGTTGTRTLRAARPLGAAREWSSLWRF